MGLSGADPGFLDRGFKFTNVGFNLLIVPDYLLYLPDISENVP